jgi:hypothetical protein
LTSIVTSTSPTRDDSRARSSLDAKSATSVVTVAMFRFHVSCDFLKAIRAAGDEEQLKTFRAQIPTCRYNRAHPQN